MTSSFTASACRRLLALALLAAAPLAATAQSVGIGTTTPNASAALDIVSPGKGVLVPRLTAAARAAIASPATGLLVFQTDAPVGFYYNSGTPAAPAWSRISTSTGPGTGDDLGNHTATQALDLTGFALTGSGADLGAAVGVGVRADGGLNVGQNAAGNSLYLGYRAGESITTGVRNQFVGYQSGLSNTIGDNNQFSGYSSGYSNTTGSFNYFSGYLSGYSNTTGQNNYFSGYQSGYRNTIGENNQFSGFQSGYRNTTGSYNHFSGYRSGEDNTTGSYNHFSGYFSGLSNTTGQNNYFSGLNSGRNNTIGNRNHFSGFGSGYSNTTGQNNYFSGYQSGGNTTTGDNNCFVGYQSGSINTTGNYNSALGPNSGPAFAGLVNTLGLGNEARPTASNSIQLGNNQITALRCQVGLTVLSDARFKRQVRADVPGLAFIRALRPVSYYLDAAAQTVFQRTGQLPATPDTTARGEQHTGFLAQQVAQAAQSLGYHFDGVQTPAHARDTYGLRYAQFVVPLVRAVQQQQEQIAALQAANAALEARASQAEADHASLLTLQAQVARLLGEAAPADAQARR